MRSWRSAAPLLNLYAFIHSFTHSSLVCAPQDDYERTRTMLQQRRQLQSARKEANMAASMQRQQVRAQATRTHTRCELSPKSLVRPVYQA